MKRIFYLTNPSVRANCKHAIDEAPENYRVEIRERTRTLDQNSMLWAMLASLSKQLKWTINGHLETLTPEEWKDVLTASLYQEQRIAAGIRGGFVMLGRRTSKMTVKQMVELIDFIEAFAAEQGVTLDERRAEVFE